MKKWTWKQCYEEALLLLSNCGINQTSNARTVMELVQAVQNKMKIYHIHTKKQGTSIS
jgi:hypothetical protein